MAFQPLMTKCEIRVRRIHANRLNFNERSKELLTDACFNARSDRETSIYLLVTFYQAHLITANFC